jgi:GcrA cell cycle regulator
MSATRSTWDSERVEQMTRGFHAGLTCSQIAREIGVTRNAVIGKLNRMGLTRPRGSAAAQRAEGPKQAKLPRRPSPRTWLPRRLRLSIAAQHELLNAAFQATPPRAEEIPIHNGRGCTLLELGQEKCRWPISSPGAADFCFCGNERVKGLPYCPGHARIAYRPAGRRSVAGA